MRVLPLLLATALAGAPALAHDAAHHHPAAAADQASSEATGVQVKLNPATLLDQQGRRVGFPDELFAGRIAIVDFVYTDCTTLCPLFSGIFADLQTRLGDRLGNQFVLVSISIDPTTDTPPRLKRYAERFEAGPGWLWITGAKPEIDRVLKGLGAYVPDFTRHPGAVLIGDTKSGRWTRLYGTPAVGEIERAAETFLAARVAEAGTPR